MERRAASGRVQQELLAGGVSVDGHQIRAQQTRGCGRTTARPCCWWEHDTRARARPPPAGWQRAVCIGLSCGSSQRKRVGSEEHPCASPHASGACTDRLYPSAILAQPEERQMYVQYVRSTRPPPAVVCVCVVLGTCLKPPYQPDHAIIRPANNALCCGGARFRAQEAMPNATRAGWPAGMRPLASARIHRSALQDINATAQSVVPRWRARADTCL